MSYTPQARDRVRRTDWGRKAHVDVRAVDGDIIFGRNENGHPGCWPVLPPLGAMWSWIKVEPRPELPELPEFWHNVYPTFVHSGAYSSESGVKHDFAGRIAYVKYVPDPDSVVWADEVQS